MAVKLLAIIADQGHICEVVVSIQRPAKIVGPILREFNINYFNRHYNIRCHPLYFIWSSKNPHLAQFLSVTGIALKLG